MAAPSHNIKKQKPHLVLHTLSLILSLTALALFTAGIRIWNANFFHTTGPVRGDYGDGLALAPLSLTILFNLFTVGEICSGICITIGEERDEETDSSDHLKRSSGAVDGLDIVRSRKRSISNHLLFTVFLLLLTPASLLLAGFGALFRFWRRAIPARATGANSEPVIICNLANVFARECEPTLYKVGELQIGGIVTGGLVWLTLFALLLHYSQAFQRCRIEEQKRHRTVRRGKRSGNKSTGHRSGRHHRQHHQSKSQSHSTADSQRQHPQGRGIATDTSREGGSRTPRHSQSNSQTSHYQAHIHSSRKYTNGKPTYHSRWHQNSNAIDQVGRDLRPTETISIWLARRYSRM